jgi:hypothetical protein
MQDSLSSDRVSEAPSIVQDFKANIKANTSKDGDESAKDSDTSEDEDYTPSQPESIVSDDGTASLDYEQSPMISLMADVLGVPSSLEEEISRLRVELALEKRGNWELTKKLKRANADNSEIRKDLDSVREELEQETSDLAVERTRATNLAVNLEQEASTNLEWHHTFDSRTKKVLDATSMAIFLLADLADDSNVGMLRGSDFHKKILDASQGLRDHFLDTEDVQLVERYERTIERGRDLWEAREHNG